MKKQDDSAFNLLLDQYQHMVYNSILNIVQHEQDAEDQMIVEFIASSSSKINQIHREAVHQ